MAKRRYKKTKRAAEVGTALVIVLGLGAGALGVALYQRSKNAVTPPLVPGLQPSPVNPPTTTAALDIPR